MCSFKSNAVAVWIALTVMLSACVTVPSGHKTHDVEVGDDAYEMLQRLEAEGLIRSGMLLAKPISRAEAMRLVLEAEGAVQGTFEKGLIAGLKKN